MPVTPFHLGPGALGKAALPARFSFLSFSVSQFAIDLEPLYYILRQDAPVHRYFHSVLGALLVSSAAALALYMSRRWVPTGEAVILRAIRADLAPMALSVGAVIGGLSHVLLDWSMHNDVCLFYPSAHFASAGGFVPAGAMYLGCALAGVLVVGVLLRRLWRAV
jgi:membrane-bound metal-dependent hydrolase YbcI (DUF457 family)